MVEKIKRLTFLLKTFLRYDTQPYLRVLLPSKICRDLPPRLGFPFHDFSLIGVGPQPVFRAGNQFKQGFVPGSLF